MEKKLKDFNPTTEGARLTEVEFVDNIKLENEDSEHDPECDRVESLALRRVVRLLGRAEDHLYDQDDFMTNRKLRQALGSISTVKGAIMYDSLDSFSETCARFREANFGKTG